MAGEVGDVRSDEEPAKVGASAVGRRKERDEKKIMRGLGIFKRWLGLGLVR